MPACLGESKGEFYNKDLSLKQREISRKSSQWEILFTEKTTTDITWIVYATKQRIAPSQRSRANPPNRHFINLIHSGVFGGGVRAFNPSLSRLALALAVVKPRSGSVVYLLKQNKKGSIWAENFRNVDIEIMLDLLLLIFRLL